MTSAIFREMEQIGRETRYGVVGAEKVESMAPSAKAALLFYGGLIVMTLNVIVITAVFIFEPSGRVPEVYGTLVGVWFATFVLNWLLCIWRI